MWDAMALEPAVFEPDEVHVLTSAFAKALRRCHAEIAARPDSRFDLARLVHNLGRSRLKFRKGLRAESDARALAEEAAEVFRYMTQAGDFVPPPEAPSTGMKPTRAVSLFPQAYRTPPADRLI